MKYDMDTLADGRTDEEIESAILPFPIEDFDPLLKDVIEWANTADFPNLGERLDWEQFLFGFDARIKWLKSKQNAERLADETRNE